MAKEDLEQEVYQLVVGRACDLVRDFPNLKDRYRPGVILGDVAGDPELGLDYERSPVFAERVLAEALQMIDRKHYKRVSEANRSVNSSLTGEKVGNANKTCERGIFGNGGAELRIHSRAGVVKRGRIPYEGEERLVNVGYGELELNEHQYIDYLVQLGFSWQDITWFANEEFENDRKTKSLRFNYLKRIERREKAA